MLTSLNQCRKAEAGPGTGESEDPSEAGAWMKEWVYSPGTSLRLLLIPPTLPTRPGPKVFPKPRAGAAEETCTTTPPSFLQTSPGPHLGVLLERGWGMSSKHCRAPSSWDGRQKTGPS